MDFLEVQYSILNMVRDLIPYHKTEPILSLLSSVLHIMLVAEFRIDASTIDPSDKETDTWHVKLL